MDKFITLLCAINFFDFTKNKPKINNNATVPLMIAFKCAKMCLSKPKSTSILSSCNMTTATKTTAETAQIKIFAFLSFLVSDAVGQFITNFKQKYGKKY